MKEALIGARDRVEAVSDLAAHTEARIDALLKYRDEYRRYCWPVASVTDLKLVPFHLLASEPKIHTDKQHTWHMKILARLCAADPRPLLPTPSLKVDLNDPAS